MIGGANGFSLIELLVALTVCALLSGAVAAVAPQARVAFEATPELLDLQQRERTVADVLTRVVRSAGLIVATRNDGTVGKRAAAVELLQPDQGGDVFHSLRVVSMVGHGRGVLQADQSGRSGSLRLDVNCPSTGEVCGFSKGTVAAVVEVAGGVDVFTVGSTSKSTHSLSPTRALSRAYASGSTVVQVSVDAYYLDQQSDGTFALVRETAAGAVQPMVDNVLELSIEPSHRAGVLQRVDLTVRLDARSTAPNRRVADRVRHFSVSLRNPS